MIVIDVNILVYALVAGQRTDSSRLLLESEPDWIAPSILMHEFLNVLATWEKRKIMNAADCQKTWAKAAGLIAGNLVEADPDATLKLAFKHKITAYDAEFIEVALANGRKLVTEDGELRRKFPGAAVSIADFLSGKSSSN